MVARKDYFREWEFWEGKAHYLSKELIIPPISYHGSYHGSCLPRGPLARPLIRPARMLILHLGQRFYPLDQWFSLNGSSLLLCLGRRLYCPLGDERKLGTIYNPFYHGNLGSSKSVHRKGWSSSPSPGISSRRHLETRPPFWHSGRRNKATVWTAALGSLPCPACHSSFCLLFS